MDQIKPANDNGTKPRGFALMTKERVRELASMGGKKVQASGRGRRWTHEEAVENGRKGGLAGRKVA